MSADPDDRADRPPLQYDPPEIRSPGTPDDDRLS